MSYLAKYDESLEDCAARLAGNWTRFDSFAWDSSAQSQDARERVAIVYTSNRDSDALDRANAEEFHLALSGWAGNLNDAYSDDAQERSRSDVQWESHNHWAVGHVDGFAIRVYGRDGKITQAFRKFYELAARLEEYPILDEDRFSEIEEDDAYEAWKHCYSVAERIAYIRAHRSQFEFSCFSDMLGCVRGKYFAGYAGELLT